MSRVLKFRGWDKSDNSGFYNHISLEEMIRCDFDIMQFTGLLDKNGAQIFEGDIVHGGTVLSNGKSVRVVKFCDVTAGFKFIEGDRQYSMMQSSDCVEIIGNIHQQPELLKDKS